MEKLSGEKFKELKNSSYLIDTRRPEIFASCHIKGSINIPGGGNFCGWASMVVPHNQPLILLVEEEEHVLETIEQLRLIGLKNILGFTVWNRSLNLEMDNLELLPVKEAHKLEDLFIIDVRTLSEWNLGHIQSAHHKELSKFRDWMKDLPEDKKIATICGSGFRSSIAASLLQKNGLEDVASIQGGMQAWKQANYPISSNH
ncbi:MAG TPA: rhodanese-like domain-containing protein [Parachlamydiaceae bacterium]|nr:rhodanese-like domain-containing protein [Parachlamydiaceae bacterium]